MAAVAAPFSAAFPSLVIVFDNAPFDWSAPPPQFVEFEIKFLGGDQIGMAQQPRTRLSGYVYVSVLTREGKGSRSALLVLDWFSAQLGYASAGAVRLQAPEPAGTSEPKGWFIEKLKIAFFADPT